MYWQILTVSHTQTNLNWHKCLNKGILVIKYWSQKMIQNTFVFIFFVNLDKKEKLFIDSRKDSKYIPFFVFRKLHQRVEIHSMQSSKNTPINHSHVHHNFTGTMKINDNIIINHIYRNNKTPSETLYKMNDIDEKITTKPNITIQNLNSQSTSTSYGGSSELCADTIW